MDFLHWFCVPSPWESLAFTQQGLTGTSWKRGEHISSPHSERLGASPVLLNEPLPASTSLLPRHTDLYCRPGVKASLPTLSTVGRQMGKRDTGCPSGRREEQRGLTHFSGLTGNSQLGPGAPGIGQPG